MPERNTARTLRPPIATANLFSPATTEPQPELPIWWPNDKQRVLDFRTPPIAPSPEWVTG